MTIPAITAIGIVSANITCPARSIFAFNCGKAFWLNNSARVGKTAVAIAVPIKVSGTCMIHQP